MNFKVDHTGQNSKVQKNKAYLVTLALTGGRLSLVPLFFPPLYILLAYQRSHAVVHVFVFY